MGNENSSLIDPSEPPLTLVARTVPAIAAYILSGNCRKIVVMSGAGISTSAGIPDFRSPETGLYANLARLNLPYAEAVFSINYFEEHPEPFYTLAQELYPGKWRPTITHVFIALLVKKGLLLKHFTQNIDCLDREAGVPGDLVIEAHGSFATSRCIKCKLEYPNDEMKEMVEKKEIPRCKDEKCNGLVKPDIVFFGEALPEAFFKGQVIPGQADLCIVLGSSLSVAPFNRLPSLAAPGVPRLLINAEIVGDLGTRADDVLEIGDCDTGIRKLAEACGWLEELEEMWNENGRKFGVEPAPKREKKVLTKDESLEAEVQKITEEVKETLRIADNHKEKVMGKENSQPKEASRPTSAILPNIPQSGHTRVKSVEEWKSEFQAAYEKKIKEDTATEAAAQDAGLLSQSNPIPQYEPAQSKTAEENMAAFRDADAKKIEEARKTLGSDPNKVETGNNSIPQAIGEEGIQTPSDTSTLTQRASFAETRQPDDTEEPHLVPPEDPSLGSLDPSLEELRAYFASVDPHFKAAIEAVAEKEPPEEDSGHKAESKIENATTKVLDVDGDSVESVEGKKVH